MKGLKNITLGVAVAAMPCFGYGTGLARMDDAALGEVTGQAGVTIDVSTKIKIDQVEYSQGNTGSLLVNDIEIGGLDVGGSTFDENLNFKVDIDLQENGDRSMWLFLLVRSG